MSFSSSQCGLSQKSKMTFYSQNGSLFSRVALYFPEVPFCFPEVSFYLMCVSFKCFFPFCLALKTSTWCMISYVFIIMYFLCILHDSLENAIFEHLEWLKLISWKHLVPFLSVSDHALVSKVAPDVSKGIFTIIDFLDI